MFVWRGGYVPNNTCSNVDAGNFFCGRSYDSRQGFTFRLILSCSIVASTVAQQDFFW